MSDRALLEMAAKAAGVEISTWSNCQAGGFVSGGGGGFWNPLTNDGDALRLAVELGLMVCSDAEGGESFAHSESNVEIETHNGDPYAATRRAIVRAAADIGKATA